MKPEMWTDGKVVRLSDAANLLFVALLNQADDSGRLQNDPKEIECRAPRFWGRAETLINELAEVGLVAVYGPSGKFLQITNFSKHQVIDRPRPSEIPSPNNRRIVGERSTQGKEGKGREGIGKDIYSQDFENLWKTYPKKVGKTEAESAFKKTVKSPEDLIAITHALENYLRSRRVIDGYAQDAHRWFKKWREWETFTEAVPEKVSPYRDTDDLKARWKAEGKSSCHGKEIVKQEDGSMRCDYCLATA